MLFSKLFSTTLRENPAGTESISHQLLLRAGYIRQLGSGIFSYLPLAQRGIRRIQDILRHEMDAIGGQEICMPVVHPADLWKESGRWQKIGLEMGRLTDRNARDLVLAMTHEEVVASLVRTEIHSYKQLPALVYHIQTKWRDDPRPRAGLIRVREFTMLDSYSLDASLDGLDEQYKAHYQAYFRIFERCQLPVVAVQSDSGMMGGSQAHEFMYLSPAGEDTLVFCSACDYAANRQNARFAKAAPTSQEELPLQMVATPNTTTIADLCEFLKISADQTAKAVFFMADVGDQEAPQNVFIFAVIRGDMEINETKLANAIKARDLRPATEEEIRHTGAVPGYASPIGLQNVKVIVDDLIPDCPNLVAGANKEGCHLLNVNYPRDYSSELVTDICSAYQGAACPHCGKALELKRGIEVGNIFKLGTRYSDSLGCRYLDAKGNSQPVIMGSYGIGVGRLLACIAEEHHDELGLCLPVSVAPFPVHMITLSSLTAQVNETATQLYEQLERLGIQVLWDQRDESPGVKFADADLIGTPFQVTISDRSLKNGGVELKERKTQTRQIIPLSETPEKISSLIDREST